MKRGACAVLEEVTETILEQIVRTTHISDSRTPSACPRPRLSEVNLRALTSAQPLYVQTRTGLEDEKIINNLLSPASRLGGVRLPISRLSLNLDVE